MKTNIDSQIRLLQTELEMWAALGRCYVMDPEVQKKKARLRDLLQERLNRCIKVL